MDPELLSSGTAQASTLSESRKFSPHVGSNLGSFSGIPLPSFNQSNVYIVQNHALEPPEEVSHYLIYLQIASAGLGGSFDVYWARDIADDFFFGTLSLNSLTYLQRLCIRQSLMLFPMAIR